MAIPSPLPLPLYLLPMRRAVDGKVRFRLGAVLLLAAAQGACSSQKTSAESTRVVLPDQPVSILVDVVAGPQPGSTAAALAIKKPAEDELAQGPSSFDVDNAGILYIADPLRRRVVEFDANGRFKRAIRLDFPADRVRWSPQGLAVRDASSGNWQRAEGAAGATVPADADLTGAKLIDGQRAAVSRPGKSDLAVELAGADRRLVSVRSLGESAAGSTYVVVETGAGGDTDSIRKQVRLYGADGRLRTATGDIPLDYYVQPNDELRVRGGVLYQLMPMENSVRINRWRME